MTKNWNNNNYEVLFRETIETIADVCGEIPASDSCFCRAYKPNLSLAMSHGGFEGPFDCRRKWLLCDGNELATNDSRVLVGKI